MLYFRGCVIREKLTGISDATQKILEVSGVNYKILSDEKCCGSFLMRTGFCKEAFELMNSNLEILKDEKILVSCAGCYRTLKQDYKELFDVKLDVVHSSEFFQGLIESGKLKLNKIPKKITYHDPCHLGRHCNQYDASRFVLENLGSLVEMEKNRENARCCGSGGGVRSAYPEISEEIASMRMEDARKTGADLITTACSFCTLNLNSACKKGEKVLDLSEIILMGLEDE
ncbi:MAG: (Fe-S)-binding protein [Methanobacteriaceae archaeon]|nr:(Fe-S)-binding protein [Methanobacteriaceae archaeon]